MPDGENNDDNTQPEPYVPDKDRGGNTVLIGEEQGYIGHVPDERPAPVIDQPNIQPVHPGDEVEVARRSGLSPDDVASDDVVVVDGAVTAEQGDPLAENVAQQPGDMSGNQMVDATIENSGQAGQPDQTGENAPQE